VPTDRNVRERELANLMSTSLVEDLRSVGLTASRFGLRDRLPRGAWLLQGTFVQVDEGKAAGWSDSFVRSCCSSGSIHGWRIGTAVLVKPTAPCLDAL
jgi:hypothetical protein